MNIDAELFEIKGNSGKDHPCVGCGLPGKFLLKVGNYSINKCGSDICESKFKDKVSLAFKNNVFSLLTKCSGIVYGAEGLVNERMNDTCLLKGPLEQYLAKEDYKKIKKVYNRSYSGLLKSKQIHDANNTGYKKLPNGTYEKIERKWMREEEYNILESIKGEESHMMIYDYIIENKKKFITGQGVWDLSTMPYDAYLRTDHWFILSNKVKERDGERCKLCNSKNQLTAHHRSYKNRGKRNEIEDLVTLCRNCHNAIHEHLQLNSKHETTY